LSRTSRVQQYLTGKSAITRIQAIIIITIFVTAASGAAAWYMVSPSAPTTTPAAVKKITVVSDIGGFGDMSYNDMALKGGRDAARDLGVQIVELTSRSEADYVPKLETAANDPDVILVVGVGVLLTNAITEVATRYPDKNFAIIDGFIPDMQNVMSILYAEHEGSAVVGAIAALTAAHYGNPHIGMVLGIESPFLWKFEIGYKWGADWALKWYQSKFGKPAPVISSTETGYRVLWTYTGTFNEISRGYEAAKAIYAMGGGSVYNAAGPLGIGINQALQEIANSRSLTTGPPFWIGVDSDQDWINPGFVVVSMMKRIDRAVYLATQLAVQGNFRQVVADNRGILTLGIGTKVSGISVEGVSVSTLADLDEFIEMGINAEKLTGEKVLPMSPEEIKTKVSTMRNALPSWIWDAERELENAIRSDANLVPLATTQEVVDQWRAILG